MKTIAPDEYYLFRPSCGREIIAIAAVNAIDVNTGFKQFVIAVDSYAATLYDRALHLNNNVL